MLLESTYIYFFSFDILMSWQFFQKFLWQGDIQELATSESGNTETRAWCLWWGWHERHLNFSKLIRAQDDAWGWREFHWKGGMVGWNTSCQKDVLKSRVILGMKFVACKAFVIISFDSRILFVEPDKELVFFGYQPIPNQQKSFNESISIGIQH